VLRWAGLWEGSAKAGNAETYDQGKEISLLTVAEELHCLRRTLIRPSGTFSRREKEKWPAIAISYTNQWH